MSKLIIGIVLQINKLVFGLLVKVCVKNFFIEKVLRRKVNKK